MAQSSIISMIPIHLTVCLIFLIEYNCILHFQQHVHQRYITPKLTAVHRYNRNIMCATLLDMGQSNNVCTHISKSQVFCSDNLTSSVKVLTPEIQDHIPIILSSFRFILALYALQQMLSITPTSVPYIVENFHK